MTWKELLIPYLEKNNYNFELKELEDNVNDVVYIKFENILIKNSKKESHLIKELFVKLQLYNGGIYIYGGKFKYTDEELYARYRHSHLSSGVVGRFDRFCLGNGYLEKFNYTSYIEPSEDNVILFFHLLNDFLKWESLEGGPHIKMENIGNPGSPISSDDYRLNVSLPLSIKSDHIDFILKNNRVIVSEDWIKEQLVPNCVEYKENYYSSSSNYGESIEDLKNYYKDNFNTPFYFKGELQEFIVKETINKKELKKVVHPITINKYGNQLSRKIKEYILQNYNSNGQIQNGSSEESVVTNDVLVLEDIF